jgi:thymidylate synthase
MPEYINEQGYLALVQDVLAHGRSRGDRTGTGTISVFGRQARFSLADYTIPLLTTKKMFWRGIVHELLWFIGGRTDVQSLQANGVHFWDQNGSREFLDRRGLHGRAEGHIGPVYGFQWRKWGAKYECDVTSLNEDDKNINNNKGIDQLAEVIRLIREEPTSRRIIMSAWNVSDLADMALPPCHILTQFYVNFDSSGEHPETLDCHMYQRSGDLGLGVPFNIASYALLTHMIAHVTGLRAGELIISFGDLHIYNNHVAQLITQLTRTPGQPPQIQINPEGIEGIDDFKFSSFTLLGYNPQSALNMNMAV